MSKRITITEFYDGFSIDIFDTVTCQSKHYHFDQEDTKESLKYVFGALGLVDAEIIYEESC